MRIREYRPSDLEALKRMHAPWAGYYDFPELEDPLFVKKLVGIGGNGEAVMGALARLTSEVYVLVDHGVGTPRERWNGFQELHEGMRQELGKAGIEDAHAFLPPGISEGFCRRLGKLGWLEESGRCFWRLVNRGN